MAKIEVTRTAPFELLNHSDLADMPDTAGTNPDHDARYQLILPIGTVLMYDGTGIANVGTRTEDIGDDVADTITFSGWKVCNGNALTPNLFNRFIRCEVASGNVGGNDAMAHTHTTPNHTHTDNFTVDNHTLIANEIPSHTHTHDHGSFNSGTISASHTHSVTGGGHRHGLSYGTTGSGYNCLHDFSETRIAYTTAWTRVDGTHTHAVGNQSANHYHAVDVPSKTSDGGTGGGAAHNHGISGGVTLSGSGTTGIASNTENRPAYYSLIFIIRMS